MPIIKIEIFFDEVNDSSLFGNHNSINEYTSGVSLKIIPNDRYQNEIKNILNNTNSFPYSYYKSCFKKV